MGDVRRPQEKNSRKMTTSAWYTLGSAIARFCSHTSSQMRAEMIPGWTAEREREKERNDVRDEVTHVELRTASLLRQSREGVMRWQERQSSCCSLLPLTCVCCEISGSYLPHTQRHVTRAVMSQPATRMPCLSVCISCRSSERVTLSHPEHTATPAQKAPFSLSLSRCKASRPSTHREVGRHRTLRERV